MQQEPGDPAPFREHEPERALSLEEFEPYVGSGVIERLERLADPVIGRVWVDVNSTFVGGGVAEMLRSIVPLARALGIDSHWYRIDGSDDFYQVTKKLHNMLQGVDCPLTTDDVFETYLGTIAQNGCKPPIRSDVVMVHDPQPLALVHTDALEGTLLWRCHLDTTNSSTIVRRFALPYIHSYSGAIFTSSSFVFPELKIPVYLMSPVIDPRSEKNTHRSEREARNVLAPLLEEHNVDPERPILANVSRYDIHKNQKTALKAFQKLRRTRKHNPPPYLIFLGNSAPDDPEGAAVLEDLKQEAGDDPDVRFWINVSDNDRVVGSLMRIARALIHVSTREGFGLVVTEALWQQTPVIGSRVGGIPLQVVHEETGYLVEPMDIDGIAARIDEVLTNPESAAMLGSNGQERVRDHFLLPKMMRMYLLFLRYYTRVDLGLPEFRWTDTGAHSRS